MEKKPGRRFTVVLNERTERMIRDIKEYYGYDTDSLVTRIALMEMYFRLPDKGGSEPKIPKKIKSTTKKKVDEPIDTEFLSICNDLKGSVDTSDGTPYCVYYTYNHTKRHEQHIPIEMLTQELINTQYFPNTETVERLTLEGKCNY